MKKIKTALISVFYKTGIDTIVDLLKQNGVQIYSTGGTYDFIKPLDPSVKTVESLTGYPSILGGRVKTLHPKVFGGILGRTQLESDQKEMREYDIPPFDLVIVDLYPFEETVASTDDASKIIEKIVSERADFVREKGMGAIGGLMGPVMGALRGKIDGKQANELLTAAIKKLLGQ